MWKWTHSFVDMCNYQAHLKLPPSLPQLSLPQPLQNEETHFEAYLCAWLPIKDKKV